MPEVVEHLEVEVVRRRGVLRGSERDELVLCAMQQERGPLGGVTYAGRRMRFAWDKHKNQSNKAKHDVSLSWLVLSLTTRI